MYPALHARQTVFDGLSVIFDSGFLVRRAKSFPLVLHFLVLHRGATRKNHQYYQAKGRLIFSLLNSSQNNSVHHHSVPSLGDLVASYRAL